MIDISKQKWDFSKEEEFAIKWFNENCFNGKLERQYVSKTIFSVEKDGVKDKFELPQGIVFKDISGYMEQYRKKLGNACRIRKIERES